MRALDGHCLIETQLLVYSTAKVSSPYLPMSMKLGHHRPRSVVIVGGGIAGIAAARKLTDSEHFRVTLLEANPSRYGGRIYSHEIPNSGGKMVDMGAMWIHGGSDPNHPITQLCTELGIETPIFHDYRKPEHVMVFEEDGRRIDRSEEKELAKILLRFNEIFLDNQRSLVDSASKDISVDTLMNQLAAKEPSVFKNDYVQYKAISMMESYCAATTPELSVKFFDGVPNSQEHVEFEGDDLVLAGGYKTLLDKLVAASPRFAVELDRRVERIQIDRSNSIGRVLAVDSKNQRFEYTVDHVIVAVPLGVLKSRSIHFEPSLPAAQSRAIDRIGFGTKMKVLLIYEEAFWPDVGILYVKSKRWPIFFLNLRKVNGLHGLLTTLDARESNAMEAMPEEAVVDWMIERLQRIVGKEKIRNSRLVYSKVTKWNSDPLIRGAYSFGKIGMKTEDAYAIRRPVAPYLYFAGEHTQFPEGEPGTVVAAFMSGQRAADEILAIDRDRAKGMAKL